MDLTGNINGETDFGTIDRYDRLGRLLSEEERKKIAKTRGLCYPCGRPTHDKRRFMMTNSPKTNEDVFEGICIKCHPDKVPKHVFEEWDKRNKPSAISRLQKAGTTIQHAIRATKIAGQSVSTPSHLTDTANATGGSRPRQLGERHAASDHSLRSQSNSNRSVGQPSFTGSAGATAKSETHSTGGSNRDISERQHQSDHLHIYSPLSKKELKSGYVIHKKQSAVRLRRRDSEASTSSRTHDDLDRSASSRTSGKRRSAGSMHRKKSSHGNANEDGSERSLSSSHFYEEDRIEQSGLLNASRRRDDWKFSKQDMSDEEIIKFLEEPDHDTVKLRIVLHTIRNEYDGGHETLLGPVKQLMKEYAHDTRILDLACGSLWRMAADDVAAKRHIVESGSIDLVLETLGKCRYDFEFAEWAMGTVMSVASHVEYKDYVSQRNAIESILETLKEHKERATIFEWSCRCLYTLLIVHKEEDETALSTEVLSRNMSSIEDFDGIAIIIDAMSSHRVESVALQVAVNLLWRLLDVGGETATNRIVRKLIAGGFVPLARRLLKQQSTSAELVESIVELLCVVLSTDQSDGSLVEEVMECLPSVVRRMGSSATDKRMQAAGLRLLAVVTVLGNVPAQILHDSAAPKVVVDALEILIADPASVTSGILSLWKLSTYHPTLLDHRSVVAALGIMKTVIFSQSFDMAKHSAIMGFVANVSGTPGLKLSDVPLKDILSARVNNGTQESEAAARLIASEVLPSICMSFPDCGNDAVAYLADDEFFKHLEDGDFDSVFPLAHTVMAIGTRAQLDLPPGLPSGIIASLAKTNDATIRRVLVDFLVCSVKASGERNFIPPTAVQTLVALFKQHQHEADLCGSILSAMAHILLVSPKGIDCRVVARAILDYVLSPSVNDDTQEAASLALWALLAKNPCDDTDLLSRIYSYTVKVFENFVGELAEAFDSSLIETTCGVLSSVASLQRSAPILVSQADVDTIVSVIYLSMEMEHDPAIPCLILEALYHFCLHSEAVLIQCGVIVVVADAIQKFNKNPLVLESGFAVLAQLASSENVHINLSIVFSDGVDSLLHGMALFPEERGIQFEGCKAFSHLSIEGETRLVICEQGGTDLIVQALESHEDDEILVEYGCSALLNLTSDAPDHVFEGTLMIQRIVSLSQKYQQISASIRRHCLGILQNISMKGAHAKDAIARSGGLVAVIRSIQEQTDSPDVLERAFTTLWSLAVLPENRDRIRRAGGIDHAVQSMLSFVEYEGVQKQACGCICTLAMDPVVCAAIRSAGGCLAILYAMRVHFSSVEVQIEAARAFHVLYGTEGGTGGPDPSEEELDAILMAMRKFPDDETLQTRTCQALCNFLICSGRTFSSQFDEVQRVIRRASSNFPSLSDLTSQIDSLM